MTDRNDFINSVKSQLDEWNGDIGALEAKLDNASDETKQELKDQLSKAYHARDKVGGKLRQPDESGEDGWGSMEGDAGNVWSAFKDSVKHFKSQL